MYRTKTSDRYFELQERVMELVKNSRTIAAAFSACNFCYISGSVYARSPSGLRLDPPELLPCVCTVGWPFFGHGGRGTD